MKMNGRMNQQIKNSRRIFPFMPKLFLSEDSPLTCQKANFSPAYQNFLGLSVSLLCLAQLFVVKITQKGKLFVELATTIESPLLFPTLDEGNCRWHHVSKEFSERCDNTWGNNRIILSQTNKHMCTQNTKRPPRTRAADWRLKRAKAHLWLDSQQQRCFYGYSSFASCSRSTTKNHSTATMPFTCCLLLLQFDKSFTLFIVDFVAKSWLCDLPERLIIKYNAH